MTDDLPDLPDVPDEAYITEPSQFEALTSGLRMRILQMFHEPSSVREVAERLDMPVTRLYYHVNLLEESGFSNDDLIARRKDDPTRAGTPRQCRRS